MRLEILVSMLIFFCGTFLTGYALCRFLRLNNKSLSLTIISGTMMWWALMELILVPMTMKQVSFSCFVWTYSFGIIVFVILGLCCYKYIWADIKKWFLESRNKLTIGHILALAFILYQLYFIHHHMYLEWDDTYYVNLANEAVYSDKIYWIYPETGTFADFDKRYVLSLWPIFYAWLSELVGVMPTVMAHTILPWLMIPLAYMVYMLIGEWLFSDDQQLQGMFLSMAVLVHLFMSGQHTSGLTFLSITPWVGKGLLACILIPTLFYWILRIVREDKNGNWIMLGISSFGGCLLSSMGIMLTPVFVLTTMFMVAVYKRKVKWILYSILSCSPCIVLGMYYIYLTH